MKPYAIALIIGIIIILGAVVLPLFNRRQFKRLPYDQQVLTVMKQAKGLVFWKNVSNGRDGNLFYVKNKRKILVYPWYINEDGKMVIKKDNPFDKWDYPEEQPALNDDEIRRAREELYKYSEESMVKVVFNDPFEDDIAQEKPEN